MTILKSNLPIDPSGPLVYEKNGVVLRLNATPCTSFDQLFMGADIALPTGSGHVLARVAQERNSVVALGNLSINTHFDGFCEIDSIEGIYILTKVLC